MKNKLLKLCMAFVAIFGCLSNVQAFTVEDLVSKGWTQVTSITDVENNYYVFVDAGSSKYMMVDANGQGRAFSQDLADPATYMNATWILEGSGDTYALKNASTSRYFNSGSLGWNNSLGTTNDNANYTFTLADGKYSIKSVVTANGYLGPWNNNGSVEGDGENIAANKSESQAPGFVLYSMSRTDYAAKALATEEGATKANPLDYTVHIYNPKFTLKANTGWTLGGTRGNHQYGQQTMESWNNNAATISQTLTSLPNGLYKVSVDIISGPNVPLNAYLYATGSAEVKTEALTAVASANDYSTMSSEVAGNTLTTDYVNVIDGSLTIGVNDPSTGNGWFVLDNFKLYYYGKDLEALENTLSAKIVEAQNVDQTYLNTPFKDKLSQKITDAQTALGDGNRTVKSLESVTSELNEIIVLANNSIHAELAVLLTACNSYATNSAPNADTYLTAFEIAITKATTDKETAATIEALNTVYTDLEAARQAYVVNAYPAEECTFDVTFLVEGVGNSTNGWVKNYSAEFTRNYQYQNSSNKNTETLVKTGYLESWNNSVAFTGTLTYAKTQLPNGHYNVSAYAFTDGTTLFTAQDKSVTVENTGMYVKPIVEDVVVNNGTLTFGLKNETGTWIGITNIELTLISDLTDAEKLAVAKEQLNATIQSVSSLNITMNIGSGLFEIPESAVTTLLANVETATGTYNDGTATAADLIAANEKLLADIEAYKNAEMQGPAADDRYHITIASAGHGRLGCPILTALGSVGTNNPTGYTFSAVEDFKNYRPTVFTFTKVSGNLYNISVELEEGTVYLTYGSLNGSPAGWNKSQIQGTTDAAAKGTFKIEASSAVDGGIRIVNTETGGYLDCENNATKNYPIFSGSHTTYEFALVDASTATTSINIAADVKLATCVLLFDAKLPTGLKAYTTESLENGYLNLVEAAELKAYTPYILYAENGYEGTLSGEVDLADYELKVTDASDLLAGAVETQKITAGYALQNQADKHGVAFYAVDTENSQTVTIPAGKCWLDVVKDSTPEATTRSIIVRFPGDETTGIEGFEIPVLIENGEIYTIDGKRVETMQSGQIYIVGGKKVIKK